jgi:AcrR family transcriptional regulator
MAKAGRRTAQDADDVRARLIDATVRVLARDGFAHASARSIAAEAGGANALIFYHFGSMDGLLSATVDALAERGIARVKEGLGGDRAKEDWPVRLGAVIRSEAGNDDGRAAMELLVGARTSPALAERVQTAIDRALTFATQEVEAVASGLPVAGMMPAAPLAELAAAAFLGLAVLAQNGRDVDIDQLAALLAMGLRSLAPR